MRTFHLKRLFVVCICAMVLVAGCQSSGGNASPQGQGAAQAIYTYLQARVQEDETRMLQLSCPNWEAQARIEATSLRGRQAKLQDVSCQEAGADGDATFVACTGKILTSYQGESRELDVAARQFKAVQQRGEWLMCGYK